MLGQPQIRRRVPEDVNTDKPSSILGRPQKEETAEVVKVRRAIYVFLNDLPENGGGELRFPRLNLQVRPREGCAVVWDIDVRGEDGLEIEASSKTFHAAMPPLSCPRVGLSTIFVAEESS
eukprot:TRINITY_DN106349_c0_g1_i1.p1 TRINITY_DN106349_c0_g1~~TRINITY_DN106349_c0_g1_i1.p1  ORF type:complete len:120 (-),score=26.60 TRINITY_DN106349_c0_g1_i1:53-412(-)